MESWRRNPEDKSEPVARISIPGGEFDAYRDNTRLYTHLGSLAIYDHVFCTRENEQGFYIFNFVDGYSTIKKFMLKNDYPAYLNQTEVAQCDVDAYERSIQRFLGDIDYLPENWTS